MLGGMSLFHWVIVGAVVLLLFGGKNKISDLMGDVAKGIKSFKKGMSDDETATAPPTAPEAPVKTIAHQDSVPAAQKPFETHMSK